MNVLSLFDGISVNYLALKNLNINIKNYYASEINKYAIGISKYNFPNIKHIGDAKEIDVNNLETIDLIAGGSPCQNFSFIGKKNGMITKNKLEITTLEEYLKFKEKGYEFEGQSYLFWEYVRILKELKPKYFLLENVKMSKKWENVINSVLGFEPVEINSRFFSAQNRKRLYWIGKLKKSGKYKKVNIEIDKLHQNSAAFLSIKDILEAKVPEKYFNIKNIERYVPKDWKNYLIIDPYNHKGIKDIKSTTLRTNYSNGNCWINDKGKLRRLTPLECERLQTLPDHYTKFGIINDKIVKISDRQRYITIGNAWTLKVIEYIYNYLLI